MSCCISGHTCDGKTVLKGLCNTCTNIMLFTLSDLEELKISELPDIEDIANANIVINSEFDKINYKINRITKIEKEFMNTHSHIFNVTCNYCSACSSQQQQDRPHYLFFIHSR